MKKTKIKKINIEINEYYCDFCFKKTGSNYSRFPSRAMFRCVDLIPYSCNRHKCYLCDQLFCIDCGGKENTDPNTGYYNDSDYNNYICNVCLKIAERYYDKIRYIYLKSIDKMSKIQKELKEECKENIQQSKTDN